MNNEQLKNEIISKFKPIIMSWNVCDIYAISFYVYDYCDNPCDPTVTLGYNTEKQYNNSVEDASDKQEARWNYAFWLQNCEFIFGKDESKNLVKQWVSKINKEDGELITKEFINVLIETVKELHKSEFIKSKFGKEIPIIIHELEYYDQIAVQNIEANTLPLVQEFIGFCQYRLE